MQHQTTVGPVHLNVRDLERLTEFYTTIIGLQATAAGDVVTLHAAGEAIIVLHHTPDAPARGRTTGLFHAAVLLPSRADLSRFLAHLAEHNYPLQGASDHLVSEALYLADPEGNGLEVYRDRPRDDWPTANGKLMMATDPLNLNKLVTEADGPYEGAPAGTTLGHIHLSVNDISAAEGFYIGELGFDLMVRYGAQATFMSAGGYHHHIGANVWNSFNAPPAPAGALGLRAWEIHTPGAAARTLTDPAGITVIIKDANGG